ncbi:helicase-exonuclease AddAB subunit AddB [Tuberibacillus sp. Marseille-P3662]|uniref:helicase-exonuclease AddAB subunit AddB n=1 Tax=Tuberibacillus sp. Marseille-P3662 TaxID=1965358 RepID=UPI000A1CAEBF|nr:helicase-exonuclease AddAB subunit AddB [Tuberibacillus sp. Marseille-P3662]
MALRLLIGRSGTGKTQQVHKEIIAELKQRPQGKPLILIVPDQMTFATEYDIATAAGLGGTTRLHVLSFSRLALRVLQETGGATRQHLSQVGLSMLLRRLVEKRSDELRIFQRAGEQKGFYDILRQSIAEFKRYCLSADDVFQQYKQLETMERQDEVLTKDKLHDLQLIYTDFEQALLDKYVDSEDYLNLLARQLPKSQWLKDVDVWMDGFDQLIPQEQEVVQALLETASDVAVTLTMDTHGLHSGAGEMSLFQKPVQTYQQLQQLAVASGVTAREPEMFTDPRRFRQQALAHLEQNYEKRPAPEAAAGPAIRMTETVNRREEVEQTAREILKLVREESYCYRDITVLTRDLTLYYDLVDSIFQDYEIPVFLDQKRPMHHHPLIEFIRSALDVIQQNWRYEAVFRCVKTDLLFSTDADWSVEREKMDQLENYVIGFGVHGSQWRSSEPWIYREYRGLREEDIPQSKEEKQHQYKLNQWREIVRRPLMQLEKDLSKAKTVIDKCTVLYQFLETMNIPEKIESLRNRAEEAGRLDEAREHDQVWRTVLDCLDQLVETGSDDALSLEVFINVLDTGLDSLTFALVPPALDQVLVGSMDRTRMSGAKAVFIVGANEGLLPMTPTEDHILNDDDRAVLETYEFNIEETSRDQLLQEEYMIYKAFAAPSERLVISYPLATENGDALMPSTVINRIKRLFPDITPLLITGDAHEHNVMTQLDFASRPMKALSHTAAQIRRWRRGYPISNIWWDAYNWLVTNDWWADNTKQVLSSLFYYNREQPLEPDVAQALYSSHIKASVSRMELYKSCPFAQFASYGLKLKERDTYRLDAPDIGQLFHSALKLMTEELMKHNRQWSELNDDECEALAHRQVEQLSPKLQKQILLSSARHEYLQHKLSQVIIRAAKTMRQQAKASGFSPVGLELPFGPDQPLPPLTFELPNGCQMEIIGRIDRVDRGYSDQGMMLRIIDYKSSATDLNLSEVYYGLALQMLAYLDVVITYAKEWLGEEADPGAVLYFHVHNPMLNDPEGAAQSVERELLKQFKMKGLVLEDEDVVKGMDQTLESGNSDIVPVGLKKNGGFYSSSSVASPDDMASLRDYVRETMADIGTNITDGDIDISPYKLKNKKPCEYCAFKSVCQFDESQPENEYRALKQTKDKDILEQIRKEDDDGDQNQ